MKNTSAYKIMILVCDRENYDLWSIWMKTYFHAQNLWNIVDVSLITLDGVDTLAQNQWYIELKYKEWNDVVLVYIK